jgi:hypothetical protein
MDKRILIEKLSDITPVLLSIVSEFLYKEDICHLRCTCKSLSKIDYINIFVKHVIDDVIEGLRYFQLKHLKRLTYTLQADNEKMFFDFSPLYSLIFFKFQPVKKENEKKKIVDELLPENLEMIFPDTIEEMDLDMGKYTNLIVSHFPSKLGKFTFKSIGGQKNNLPTLPPSLKELILTEEGHLDLFLTRTTIFPKWIKGQNFSCLDKFMIESDDSRAFTIPRTRIFHNISNYCITPSRIVPETLELISGILVDNTVVPFLENCCKTLWSLSCNISLTGNEFDSFFQQTPFLQKLFLDVKSNINLVNIQKCIEICKDLHTLRIDWDPGDDPLPIIGQDFSDDFKNDHIKYLILGIEKVVENQSIRISLKGFTNLIKVIIHEFPYLSIKNVPNHIVKHTVGNRIGNFVEIVEMELVVHTNVEEDKINREVENIKKLAIVDGAVIVKVIKEDDDDE